MGCQDDTQIHTHMCYSEFNDILPAIAALDADVITIETSRSDMELLTAFGDFKYRMILALAYMTFIVHAYLQQKKLNIFFAKRCKWCRRTFMGEPRLWIKTRGWPETIAALKVMVDVTKNYVLN